MQSLVLGLLLCLQSLHISRSERDFGPGFGVKTSYVPNINDVIRNPFDDGCTPLLFWHLARHGTRTPVDSDIALMQWVLPAIRDRALTAWAEGRTNLDDGTILKLQTWEFTLSPEEDNLILTQSGRKECLEIGTRWRQRLENVTSWEMDKIEVYSSDKSRCVESAEAFMEGLLENQLPVTQDNDFIRYYTKCSKYMDTVLNGEEPYQEENLFAESEVFTAIANNVEDMTGVNLTSNEIALVWEICRFEVAWFPGVWSPWCNFFTQTDLKALDFKEDLRFFYIDGYAYDITAEMTQPLWQDLISRMDDIVETGSTANSTVIMYGHSETVNPFIVSLGLYNDERNLTASGWPAEDREWKTSRLNPFSSNVDVVVLQCQSDDFMSLELKVAVFNQEKQMALPGNVTALEDFLMAYRALAEEDFDTLCQNNLDD